MHTWQSLIGISAGLLSLLAFIPYIVTICQRKTQPNPVTWWIWTIVGLILASSYHSSGAVDTLWVPLCLALGHLIIATLSLNYGQGGWHRFDRGCLLLAGISLFLWWQLQSPLVALVINIVIDFIGALPTIRKAYLAPATENLLSWLMFWVAHTLNLLALENWSVSLSAYPTYLFCMVTFIVSLLIGPKWVGFYSRQKRRKRYQYRIF